MRTYVCVSFEMACKCIIRTHTSSASLRFDVLHYGRAHWTAGQAGNVLEPAYTAQMYTLMTYFIYSAHMWEIKVQINLKQTPPVDLTFVEIETFVAADQS
jgi:hypothetical protein